MRYKHNKRGGFYRVLFEGTLQVSHSSLDGVRMVIYQAESDGSVWARPHSEFYDGRFEQIKQGKDETLRLAKLANAMDSMAEQEERLVPRVSGAGKDVERHRNAAAAIREFIAVRETLEWEKRAETFDHLTHERNSQIPRMVDRFLSWKLPDDFEPDGGINYRPTAQRPTGTNLFSAMQTTEMVEHMLETSNEHMLSPVERVILRSLHLLLTAKRREYDVGSPALEQILGQLEEIERML